IPGNPQPPGYLPLRKPFYCIESSDKLVLIHFDHLLTSCTRSGGTFNVQEFDQSGSLLRQRFPQKWISFMLASTPTTAVRRRISLCRRSSTFVEDILRPSSRSKA